MHVCDKHVIAIPILYSICQLSCGEVFQYGFPVRMCMVMYNVC